MYYKKKKKIQASSVFIELLKNLSSNFQGQDKMFSSMYNNTEKYSKKIWKIN